MFYMFKKNLDLVLISCVVLCLLFFTFCNNFSPLLLLYFVFSLLFPFIFVPRPILFYFPNRPQSRVSFVLHLWVVEMRWGGFTLEKIALKRFMQILFFVLPVFELQVEVVPELDTSFRDKAIDLRVGAGIDKLKYFVVFNEYLLKFIKVLLIFLYIFPRNVSHARRNDIFIVQIHKIF